MTTITITGKGVIIFDDRMEHVARSIKTEDLAVKINRLGNHAVHIFFIINGIPCQLSHGQTPNVFPLTTEIQAYSICFCITLPDEFSISEERQKEIKEFIKQFLENFRVITY